MKIFQHIAANRRPENQEMVKIVEVGPRDGLQNETAHIPTEVKIAFVDNLSASGVGEIEVSAFVSPRRVPQLGDAEDVFGRISRADDVVYSALVPNEKGKEDLPGCDSCACATGKVCCHRRKVTT